MPILPDMQLPKQDRTGSGTTKPNQQNFVAGLTGHSVDGFKIKETCGYLAADRCLLRETVLYLEKHLCCCVDNLTMKGENVASGAALRS